MNINKYFNTNSEQDNFYFYLDNGDVALTTEKLENSEPLISFSLKKEYKDTFYKGFIETYLSRVASSWVEKNLEKDKSIKLDTFLKIPFAEGFRDTPSQSSFVSAYADFDKSLNISTKTAIDNFNDGEITLDSFNSRVEGKYQLKSTNKEDIKELLSKLILNSSVHRNKESDAIRLLVQSYSMTTDCNYAGASFRRIEKHLFAAISPYMKRKSPHRFSDKSFIKEREFKNDKKLEDMILGDRVDVRKGNLASDVSYKKGEIHLLVDNGHMGPQNGRDITKIMLINEDVSTDEFSSDYMSKVVIIDPTGNNTESKIDSNFLYEYLKTHSDIQSRVLRDAQNHIKPKAIKEMLFPPIDFKTQLPLIEEINKQHDIVQEAEKEIEDLKRLIAEKELNLNYARNQTKSIISKALTSSQDQRAFKKSNTSENSFIEKIKESLGDNDEFNC